MERDDDMVLALDRYLTTVTAPPERPGTGREESRLNIVVIFTSADATIAALKTAGMLAASLGTRITLVIPQVVPYPLPLTSPPVLLDFQENRFREIAKESLVDIQLNLYLCRDAIHTLKTVLATHSLVVVGGRRRWWRTREKTMAHKLKNAGHEVIFAEMD
jgi:hypothetical protein